MDAEALNKTISSLVQSAFNNGYEAGIRVAKACIDLANEPDEQAEEMQRELIEKITKDVIERL